MSARPPASAEVPRFAKDGGKNAKTKDGKGKQVVPVSTAKYGCINWRWWLNNVTISAGLQNVTMKTHRLWPARSKMAMTSRLPRLKAGSGTSGKKRF
jgi:hypothetical protein